MIMKCTLHRVENCRRTVRCLKETDRTYANTPVRQPTTFNEGGPISPGGLTIDPYDGNLAYHPAPGVYIDVTSPSSSIPDSSPIMPDPTPPPDPTPSYTPDPTPDPPSAPDYSLGDF